VTARSVVPSARHDVVVIGGGPAGAATAALLARRGWSVAVADRPTGRRPRLGETVPAEVVAPLVHLGLWAPFLAAGHVPVPGTVVGWGSPTPHERDSILDPYGFGWHLDRPRFDAMVLAAARDAGVAVRSGTVLDCHHDGADGWTVRVAGPDRATLRAPWVVDASGRSARIARLQGVDRIRHDRLLGLARFYRMTDGGDTDGGDTRTVIEATEPGWWYAAPLPGGRAVAVLFTDADLLPRSAARRAQRWDELLRTTALVRDRLDPGTAVSPLCVAPADSGTLTAGCGPGWLAVGDAAQSWDPLSGQGITNALASALAAVEVLGAVGMLQADRPGGALEHYADRLRAGFRTYLRERSAQYGRETRWPDSPFWRRRIRR
jgi:flavin-dependent dehydrogenase